MKEALTASTTRLRNTLSLLLNDSSTYKNPAFWNMRGGNVQVSKRSRRHTLGKTINHTHFESETTVTHWSIFSKKDV